MLDKIESKIEELRKKNKQLLEVVERIDGYLSGDFDPSDDGNYDDAYHMGTIHGEVFADYRSNKIFLEYLEKLLKENK